MSEFVRGLKCRICGKAYGREPLNFCTEDFGPLEVDYDYGVIAEAMSRAKIVSREEWLAARLALLEREKEHDRRRDALSAARRELPWVKVEKAYVFDAPSGKLTLRELFGEPSRWVLTDA